MALSRQGQAPAWHVAVRLAGLTGLVAVAVGLVIFAATEDEVGLIVAGAGGALAALALLVELKAALALVLSRRGAAGSSVALQVLLAAALLAGVNAFSFLHYARFDWTRDREFTLEEDPTVTPAMRRGLRQLRGETRIVVYQRHAAFGQESGRQDSYSAAAERQIVEKVKDLAEQFQELGPRFHVEVLDSQEQDFKDRLETIRKQAPKLAEAIDAAPEDSLFFWADGRVQRLAFHDVYELDRPESEKGRGNLVLRFQGRGAFARRVLNIEERRPRVAVAAVHPWLGLDNNEEIFKDLGMAGAKKALVSRGFTTRDIVLKKWTETAPPEPAVLTRDESRYEELEEQLAELEATVKSRQAKVRELGEARRFWAKSSLAEINKRYTFAIDDDGDVVLVSRAVLEAQEKKAGRKLRRIPIREEHRQRFLQRSIEPQLALHELNLQAERKELNNVRREMRGLNVEDLSEQRRITDLRAKLGRMLADCDLLVVPRLTLVDVVRPDRNIPNRVHRLEAAQLDAVKDFVKAGKPVLFCLGPSNEPRGRFDPAGGGPDNLEGALQDLGFVLPKQTTLFNAETKAFGERRGVLLIMGTGRVEVPPLEFDWKPGGRPNLLEDRGGRAPNPIRTSLRVSALAAGAGMPDDLRLRHPRPVYYEPAGRRPAFDPVFLMTSPDAWNEPEPFPTPQRTPRYEPPKPGDPNLGTVRERRTGQFPVGVSAEVTLPPTWAGKAAKVRVAVIGHGGVFTGPNLSPVREKLLLDVSNWLLGRDDLLARDSATWSYPRVELSDAENGLWQWGTRLGMPLLFVYLGFVVLMVRRMR
jgi:hypothetical protein